MPHAGEGEQVATTVVGVAGHRDLSAGSLRQLTTLVGERLACLRQAFGRDMVVLCGMAEGADLLVARAALAAGLPLEAILALPPDEFARDLSSKAVMAEFRELLPRCQAIRVVDECPRPACYAAVADQIALRSDVLLLLWDGEPARGPGGTGDVLERFVAAKSDVVRPPGPTGLLAHFKVERSSGGTLAGAAPVCLMRYVDGSEWAAAQGMPTSGRRYTGLRGSP